MKILFALASCMFLASVGTSIPNVALPILAGSFSVTTSEIQWVIISSLLANTISIVVAGKIGDLYGRQKVLLLGIFLYAISAILSGLSTAFWMLIVGRILQGFSSSFLMALSVALVSELIPSNKIGRAMGILGTSSAIGTASGPSVGGFILAALGWRSIFFFVAVLGILSFAYAYFVFPRMTQIEKPTKRSYQLIQFATFKELHLTPNFIMNVCVSAVMMSTLIAGPFYLTNTLKLDISIVGLVMTVGPVMSILTGIPAGRIADKVGASKVLSFGLFQIIVGALSFSILPRFFGLGGYVISAAILSPGYQMFQAANNTLVMKNVPEDQRGAISGVLSLSRNLGLLAGASLMGSIFFSYGMVATFLVAAFLAFIALMISVKPNLKRNKYAEILLIGCGGTLAMDLWAFFLRIFGIKSLSMDVLGKWVINLSDLPFRSYDVIVGWLIHYSIGITFSALLVSVYGWNWLNRPTIRPALMIGTVTVLAPFLILQPALGLGYFASLSPNPLFLCAKSLITHIVFGFGMYLSARGLKEVKYQGR